MARRAPEPIPEEPDAEAAPRRRSAASGPSGAAWLMLIGTVLLTGVAVGGRLLARRAQEQPAPAVVSEAPPVTTPEQPIEDPFAGFVAPEGSLKKGNSGSGSGRGGSAFAAALRLSSDPSWTVAVERARRGFELLEQAGREQSKNGNWRSPAREARELLQQALESTEAFEERLAGDPAQKAVLAGVSAEREIWRRREYELHRLLGV